MTDDAGKAQGISQEEHNKQIERARKFEAQVVDLEHRLKSFEGIDPVAFKAMKEDYDLIKKEQAKGDPQKIDELVSGKVIEARKEAQKIIDDLKADREKLSAENKELRVVDKVFALASSRFNDDTHEDVRSYIRRFCDINKEGEIIVKDEKGSPRFVEGSASQVMGAEHFVDWLVNSKPSWAKPQGTGGVKERGQTSYSKTDSITPEQYLAMGPEKRAGLPREVQHKLASAALKTLSVS